jgi:predicted O-methyltransferase YrrM
MDLFEILKQRCEHVVPEEGYVSDLQGWMPESFVPQFIRSIKYRGKTLDIVEVGTWKGTSAIEMANTCRELGIRARIICVDTWLGSPEHFTELGNYGDLYSTFVKNVKSKGFGDVIVPLALPSLQAIEVIKRYQVSPDIVYIDAAHEYLPVKMDMEAYWDILKQDGVLLGDDYYSQDVWPGVFRAVNEFVSERNLQKNSSLIIPTWSIKKTDPENTKECTPKYFWSTLRD